MKKLVLVAVLLLGFSVMAVAQDVPAVEVFGGYSFLRLDTETAFGAPSGEGGLNLNGWNANIAFNGNNWLGLVADFAGHYGTLDTSYDYGQPAGSWVSWADVSLYSIMLGPKISIRRGKVTPFLQGLFGYAHGKAKELGVTVTENDFAMAFGGGLDINMSDRIALRPAQVEYFTIKSAGSGNFSDNFRYSAGIVFKVGSR